MLKHLQRVNEGVILVLERQGTPVGKPFLMVFFLLQNDRFPQKYTLLVSFLHKFTHGVIVAPLIQRR